MAHADLVSLVYVSSAVGTLAEHDILNLLRASRENNLRDGITGVLLYKGGNFMQVLEGPEGRVLSLAEKLSKDSRHWGMRRLIQKRIRVRSFAQWPMAFHNLDAIETSTEHPYSPFLTTSFLDEKFRAQPEVYYRLLTSFNAGMR
jgi:hypothetical protein